MEILVVLRNLYNNPDPFEGEKLLSDSDINALTEACQLRDALLEGAEVTALLISESQADSEAILKKAASYGADKVIHAPCDGFDFSDANTFGRLIAELIKDLSPSPDLILFGRLAYDGDSVNIATQTAENLEWHRAIYSEEILEASVSNAVESGAAASSTTVAGNSSTICGQVGTLTYKKAAGDGSLSTIRIPLPAVVHTVRKGGLRGQAKIADIIRAYGETQVEYVDEGTMEEAVKKALLGPSLPTPIQEIPPYVNKGEMIDLKGVSDVDTAANIIETLKKLGFEPKE